VTSSTLAELIRDRREQILSRFVADVQRKDLSPPGTSRALLVDHIPTFLDEVATELRHVEAVRTSLEAIDTSEAARRHGEQRWGLGYDLEALVREYGLLRHSILQTAKEVGAQLSIDEFDALAKCLSVGVSEAASEYVKHRDQQVDAERAQLEFLAEAGQLLTSSLDYRSTLSRLTGLLVPRLADWCAVHIEGGQVDDMPLGHVDPTKVDVLREIYRRYPLPGEALHGYPHVLRTGEPELVVRADAEFVAAGAQSPEHLALIRAINTCSWLIVPLRVQGTMFGALTLGYSDSGRHYGERDLVLAGEVARRASVAIDNAKLYELSQHARSRVEAATRAKDEFVAMVSHELRTPMNAILGWLRLLRGGSLPDAKREHAFEVIERNAQAQSQLVADLLDISRIIAGKVRINPSQVDLSNVVEMAIEGVRPAADAKRIQIEVDIDRLHADMRGDADRLQQVVWNLLANAVKFTSKNGLVRVQVRRVESSLVLTVEDNGVGIAADFLPHVFDSFRQFDAAISRAYAGLGIGLSIAKHIVELHGGTIEANSPGPGRGATFLVRLPISPLVSTTMGISRAAATKQRDPVEPAVDLEGARVLVVDDEPDARELVSYVLQTAGAEVHVAASAAEAVTDLANFTPHVIVSDIGMAEEDGYSLIRRIRTLSAEAKRNIPAIALTAFARNDDRAHALVEGFNQHMTKPVEPAALVSAVAALSGHLRR
jgi:signal transduction histidine kinase/ActR/RegA family two-component response regulator